MFQFPGLSPPPLWIRGGGAGPPPGGFAHSETRGSTGACPSPRIIAACRVLHRLHVPRHPPCAHRIFPPAPGRDAASDGPPRGGPGCRIPRALGPATRCNADETHLLLRKRLASGRPGPPGAPLADSKNRSFLSISRDDLVSFNIQGSIGRRALARRPVIAMRLSRCAGSSPGGRTRGGRKTGRAAPGAATTSFSLFLSWKPVSLERR